MAVTVADNRTIVDGADATTGWSSPVAGETLNLFTSDPAPVEDSGCLGMAVSTQTSEIVHTEGGTDQSDALVYVWVLANGTMDLLANGGIELVIGDGTDTIGFQVAGADVAAFRHGDGPVGWQCLLIDTSALPTGATAHRGVVGNLTLTAITEYGAAYKTLSKALGGASNCFTDIIRYDSGFQGISISGGASGTPGKFTEIAALDRDPTNTRAFGIIRELGAGLFGVQGTLRFGSTGAHWFDDQNVVVVWEDRDLDVDKYHIILVADGAGISHFQLGEPSGTDGGSDGCSLIVPAGVGGTWDFTDADFDEVRLYASIFSGWDQSMSFSDNATTGVNHDIFACQFIGCAEIALGRVNMRNCTIASSAAGSTEGALLIDDSDNDLFRGPSFISAGTGHAIRYRPTGAGPHSLTLIGHDYSGYASSDGSTGDEVILYDPVTLSADATLTITASGDTPTIMLAPSVTGAVTVVNNKTVTFTGMRDNSEVRVFNASSGAEIAGIEDATAGSPDARTFAWTAAAGLGVDYVIHNWEEDVPVYETIRVNDFTVPNDDVSIAIQQRLDRNAV